MIMNRSVFEPGNGTRYDVVFGEYEDINQNNYCLISWLAKGGTGGPSFTWSTGSHVDLSYFCEKTGIGLADSAAILSWIKDSHPESIGNLHGLSREFAAYLPDSISSNFKLC